MTRWEVMQGFIRIKEKDAVLRNIFVNSAYAMNLPAASCGVSQGW
jgi:hypothetical protein